METMTPQTPETSAGPDWTRPRPIDTTYWVVPGRLLVGEHPGSRSRAQSMERLRRFLEAGITCFIDLTEPDEVAGLRDAAAVRNTVGTAHRLPARADPRPRCAGRPRDHGPHPRDAGRRSRDRALRVPALPGRHWSQCDGRRLLARRAQSGRGRGRAHGTRRLLAAVPAVEFLAAGAGNRASRRSSCARGSRCGASEPRAERSVREACGSATRPGVLRWSSACAGAGSASRWATRSAPRTQPAAAQRLVAGVDAAHVAHALSCREPGRSWPLRCARPDRALLALVQGRTPVGHGRTRRNTRVARCREGAGHLPLARLADGRFARSEGRRRDEPAPRSRRRAVCRQRSRRGHRTRRRVFAHHAPVAADPRCLPRLLGDAGQRTARPAVAGVAASHPRTPGRLLVSQTTA